MKKGKISFTTSQKELIPKIEAFLNGPERIFLLTGMPGVGKTFMAEYMLHSHIEADKNATSRFNVNVAGICLAHRAKNVLRNAIPNVYTFAKAYGLKEDINEETGEQSFIYDKYNDGFIIGQQNIPVFVHDECSQYTDDMLKIVLEKTQMFSKIIFMGDRAQLPPIDPNNKMLRDADSPVFYLDIPEECKHDLDEIVRQKQGNSILELSKIIRAEIFGLQRIDVILEAMKIPDMTNGSGYDYVTYDNFLRHFQERDMMNTLMIAYRRNTVAKWNPDIRNFLLGNPDGILVPGDIVTMTDSFYKMSDDGDTVEYVLENGETFKIREIYTSIIKVKAGDSYAIECYTANIEGRMGQFIIPTEGGEMVFQRALAEIADKCKRRELKWHLDFWPLRKRFCRYSYAYATTAYKAQGSTYKSVYLDINDVLTTGPLTRKRKLQTIYTAITRAEEDVHFLKSN